MRHVLKDLLAIPAMVAARDDLDAQVEKLFGDFRSDAKAGSGVFAIGNHQINLAVLDQVDKAFLNNLTPGKADNVADEQYSHGETKLSETQKWSGLLGRGQLGREPLK